MRDLKIDPVISRRRFVTAALACGCMVGRPALGQSPGPMKRVGFLTVGADLTGLPRPFSEALRSLGWVEGDNIRFTPRSAPRSEDLASLAAELVDAKVDLIITLGTPAARAAMQATRTIPVVIQVGADPKASGLVQSLNRPGGNLTGFFNGGLEDKLLELIKEVRPGAKIVAFPSLRSPLGVDPAARFGLTARGVAIDRSADIDVFIAFTRSAKADAVVVPGYPWMREYALGRIAQAMLASRIVSIGEESVYAEAGGLMSFSSLPQFDRIAAKVDRLLRGESPAEMPVEQPTRFHIAVNRRTAKAIGVAIPPSIQRRTDQYFD